MTEDGTIANLIAQMLKELGEDVEREGLDTHARARREGAALSHVGLRPGRQGDPQRRHVRRGLRRDGDREGHRLLARYASTTCCPSSGSATSRTCRSRKIVGLSEDPAAGRDVQPAAAGAGAADDARSPARSNEVLQPRGVAVVMEAIHLCMLMRGVEKQNSKAITSAMLGAFRDRPETRAEFMELIKSSRGLQI